MITNNLNQFHDILYHVYASESQNLCLLLSARLEYALPTWLFTWMSHKYLKNIINSAQNSCLPHSHPTCSSSSLQPANGTISPPGLGQNHEGILDSSLPPQPSHSVNTSDSTPKISEPNIYSAPAPVLRYHQPRATPVASLLPLLLHKKPVIFKNENTSLPQWRPFKSCSFSLK